MIHHSPFLQLGVELRGGGFVHDSTPFEMPMLLKEADQLARRAPEEALLLFSRQLASEVGSTGPTIVDETIPIQQEPQRRLEIGHSRPFLLQLDGELDPVHLGLCSFRQPLALRCYRLTLSTAISATNRSTDRHGTRRPRRPLRYPQWPAQSPMPAP